MITRRLFLQGVALAAIAAPIVAKALVEPSPAPEMRYVHKTYGLAYAYTNDQMSDADFERIGREYSRALAKSLIETKERMVAGLLSKAFTH